MNHFNKSIVIEFDNNSKKNIKVVTTYEQSVKRRVR